MLLVRLRAHNATPPRRAQTLLSSPTFSSSRSLLRYFITSLLRSSLSRDAWQFDDKFRSAIFLRHHADPPAVRLHNLVNDRQSQSCPARKSRLQRFEDLGALLRVQANTRIPKCDPHPERTLLQPYG